MDEIKNPCSEANTGDLLKLKPLAKLITYARYCPNDYFKPSDRALSPWQIESRAAAGSSPVPRAKYLMLMESGLVSDKLGCCSNVGDIIF